MKTFQAIYQKSYEEIEPHKGLIENMLEEAGEERRRWLNYAVLRPIAAALVGLLVLFGGTSALASNVGAVYEIIEKTSPALADLFVPVQESCTRAGICMEVEAIYLEDDDKKANVYISFRDTQGDRIGGAVDLYDSYSLSSVSSLRSAWVAGGISYAGYDEESGKAYYQLQLSADVPYDRSKLTLRVRELLTNVEAQRRDIALSDIADELPTKELTLIGSDNGNWEQYAEYYHLTMEKPVDFINAHYSRVDTGGESFPEVPGPWGRVQLLDGIPVSECAVDDFTITGLAYGDHVLRLQICMGDLSHADRHVQPFLVLADGSERHEWFSRSWHEEQADTRLMFYEYYLPCTPEELETAGLYGIFHTADNSLEGNWKVTFRVEEKAEGSIGVFDPVIP